MVLSPQCLSKESIGDYAVHGEGSVVAALTAEVHETSGGLNGGAHWLDSIEANFYSDWIKLSAH